jgi:hypothetical protein
MIKRFLLSLAFLGMTLFATQISNAGTLVVDDDGFAAVGNCDATTPTYAIISLAVAAASSGDTIRVCPGVYADNVVVDKSLTLLGAQAGNPFIGRTFPSTAESTVAGALPNVGVFSVEAPNVTIDGFSVTNPGNGLGIIVKTAGNRALLTNNIIDTVGGVTFGDNTVGIYLEYGPDRVRVEANWIRNIASGIRTAQGILIGDSTSGNPSLNILVTGNRIEKITSAIRGTYGIQVNNGASTAPTATGYTTVEIRCNTIDSLTGNWAHAIGLEGPTPNVLVDGNSISNLVDVNPTPIADAVAVFFEANPFFPTAEVHFNNFNVTTAAYGIAVHPALWTIPGDVNGTRNWWGHSSGPGPVGPGIGARVSPKVRYAPWLRSPAPCGRCSGSDDNDHGADKNDEDGNHGNRG